jgi:hypothetical protein
MAQGPEGSHPGEKIQYKDIWSDPFLVERMTDWFSAGASARVVWENLLNVWDEETQSPGTYANAPRKILEEGAFKVEVARIKNGYDPRTLITSPQGRALLHAIRTTEVDPESRKSQWSNTTRFIAAYMTDVLHVPSAIVAGFFREHFLGLSNTTATSIRSTLSKARGKGTDHQTQYPYTEDMPHLMGTEKENKQFFHLIEVLTHLSREELLTKLVVGTAQHARQVEQHYDHIRWNDENLFFLAGLIQYCGLHPHDIETVMQDVFNKKVSVGYARKAIFAQTKKHPELMARVPLESPEKRAEFEALTKARLGLTIPELITKYKRKRGTR